MTVKDFLGTLPEEHREMMAEFLYSRTPYRFNPRDTRDENTLGLYPTPSVLSLAHQA